MQNYIKSTVLGIICCTAISACGTREGTDKNNYYDKPLKVEVYSPEESHAGGIYINGKVRAEKTVDISTRVMGYITRIYVKPGDKVKKGNLLVSVNSDDLNAKKARAEAMVAEAAAAAGNAQKDYERYRELRKSNSVSDKELENASLQKTSMQAKLQMAGQQLQEIKAMLAYTNIKAPFSGTITQKIMDEGGMANPGMPLLTMEQDGKLQVIASVPESYIKYVKTGNSVKVNLKAAGEYFNGEIMELSPSSFSSGGQYAIKISVPSGCRTKMRAGMYASVFIPGIIPEVRESGLLLRKSSIVHKNQLTGVYVVDDKDRAMLRWVRLGKSVGDKVEVLSGVGAEDKVILKLRGKLFNGKKVLTDK
ncbi:MAG: efflux RND transporter periplasmic adaptor subunit [Bacteroidales bacterium]|jgi:RND family efflux transporter MFP subunit|nr:efflux RND transporter periplasmic adaptor subunit [Bacteroidales bacterium]